MRRTVMLTETGREGPRGSSGGKRRGGFRWCRVPVSLGAALLAAALLGCGGGASGPVPAPAAPEPPAGVIAAPPAAEPESVSPALQYGTDNFTPNYALAAAPLTWWRSVPVKVAFANAPPFADASIEAAAARGVAAWASAGVDRPALQWVSDPGQANITLAFVTVPEAPAPEEPRGITTMAYDAVSHEMRSAAVEIYFWEGMSAEQRGRDVAVIAAHELGHALGIRGHSDDANDLMHPLIYVTALSGRDANTMKTAYSHLWLGGRRALLGAPGGRTVRETVR